MMDEYYIPADQAQRFCDAWKAATKAQLRPVLSFPDEPTKRPTKRWWFLAGIFVGFWIAFLVLILCDQVSA